MTHALTAAGAKPYGDVSYADPGYQDDKKKRYPLDSEEHCRAAWSYINQSGNAGKYSPEQLKRIKGRIKAAGKKYGIDFADDTKVAAAGGPLPDAMVADLARGGREVSAAALRDIELARPGTWKLASGPLNVTPKMLDDAARFANRENARPGYLKIGHTDVRFMASDGEPALGWLHNVRLEEDDEGHVLKGDLHDVPDWLATAIPKHWPDRSIEGYADYEHDGEKYGLVVDGLALLGVTPPGMSSIKSLRDLPQALGLPVAASNGTRIIASFGDQPSTQDAPETPARKAGPSPTRKGAGMPADPVEIREALGLGPDASDTEVRAAFDAEIPPPAGTPVSAAAPGTVVLAASVWEEQQQTIKRLNNFVEATKRDQRDEVIGQAVMAGKFTPAQRKQFSDMWDSNPEATRALIEVMTPNSAFAVVASGYAGEGVEVDAEYLALYGGAPDARKAG